MAYDKEAVYQAANGRWPEILNALTGMDMAFFRKKHQPCPMCGGTDRYRFINKGGSGDYICNQCGAGYGIHLFTRYSGADFPDAINTIGEYLGVNPDARPAPEITRQSETPNRRESKRVPLVAAKWLSRASRAPINQYCASRLIAPGDLMVTDSDVIIVPLVDGGRTVDAAAISPDGNVAFASKESPLNAWTLCGNDAGKSVFICIDWADSHRVAMLTKCQVLCAWTADNMIELAHRFRHGFDDKPVRLALNISDHELISAEYTSLACIIPSDSGLIRQCSSMQPVLHNPSELLDQGIIND